MSVAKIKKESIISELKTFLDNASILVFVNFHGLSVAKERKLRSVLRASGIKYKVVKKTLLRRVFESVGLKDMPKLEGEVGVIAGIEDVSEPPRLITKFMREELRGLPPAKQGLKILGGVYESAFVDDLMIKKLAAIPSREALLTELAFILTQPVASFARVLDAVMKSKVEQK